MVQAFQHSMDDTISAIATAPGEGGIGIVRLSGPAALVIAGKLFRGIKDRRIQAIKSYQAAYGNIVDPDTGQAVDEALVLVMRNPHSYTKEDVVEIQCHGGMVPLRRILELTVQAGARIAEPGEFTKRAFLNGRLDLSQAEAVIDVIRAKTDASLKMAVGQLNGAVSQKVQGLRQELLAMIAHLEAAIDFPEEDIDAVAVDRVQASVNQVLVTVNAMLATASTGQILREGLATVIIGKPNVGKSSLLNALSGQNRAIVTDIPGTTRDIIEEYVNIRGIPLRVLDTAGIRDTADAVEQIGVERAKASLEQADLILLVLDASTPLTTEDRQVITFLTGRKGIVLVNKSDLPAVWDIAEIQTGIGGTRIISLSIQQGSGLDRLEQAIVDMVYSGSLILGEGGIVNNVRHIMILRQAKSHLEAALATICQGMPLDCISIDIRAAWEKLGEITGDTLGEDIIDKIFSEFCIGK